MDEWVEVGVYEWPDGKPAELIYVQPHRLKSGMQTLAVTVKKQPWRIATDPRNWLTKRNADFSDVELTPERRRSGADTTEWRARYERPKRRPGQVEFKGL